MSCRVIKREEFVARMLAAQELRKESKRMARIDANDAIGALIYKREAQSLRRRKYKK